MTKRFFRWFGIAALITVVSIFIFFEYFELKYFRPYLPQIEGLYTAMPEQEKHLPEFQRMVISKMLDKDNAQFRIDSVVGRHLISELSVPHRSAISWHLLNLLWILELRLHVSTDVRFALYCHVMRFDDSNNKGLLYGSLSKFQKPPSELNVSELATLLTIQRAPAYYRRHPDALEEGRVRLIEQYNGKSNGLPAPSRPD
jgi:hypothetical protein